MPALLHHHLWSGGGGQASGVFSAFEAAFSGFVVAGSAEAGASAFSAFSAFLAELCPDGER
jgi:hypothetical protein